MAQLWTQRLRMSPEWCSILTNVQSKIYSNFRKKKLALSRAAIDAATAAAVVAVVLVLTLFLGGGQGPTPGLWFYLWLSLIQITESCIWDPSTGSPAIPL